MAKESGRPYNLAKKVVIAGAILVFGLAGSVLNSGCSEGQECRLYFGANDPTLKLLHQEEDAERRVENIKGLPLLTYKF